MEARTLCMLDCRECPGTACPFWVLGECLFSDLDVSEPDVAEWLLRLRAELEE